MSVWGKIKAGTSHLYRRLTPSEKTKLNLSPKTVAFVPKAIKRLTKRVKLASNRQFQQAQVGTTLEKRHQQYITGERRQETDQSKVANDHDNLLKRLRKQARTKKGLSKANKKLVHKMLKTKQVTVQEIYETIKPSMAA